MNANRRLPNAIYLLCCCLLFAAAAHAQPGRWQWGIGTSVHFIPVHTFTYYREKYGYRPGDFPVAFRESERLVSLPLHPGLSDDDVRDVVAAVKDLCGFS